MASPSSPALSSRFQLLYKAKTPPWRETYRNRCRDSLRRNRQTLFQSFRDAGDQREKHQQLVAAVSDVVRGELEKFHAGPTPTPRHSRLTPLAGRDGATPPDDADFSERLLEETLAELMEEEMQVWRLYEETMRAQEMEVQAAVSHWSSDDGVVCPVCLRLDLTKSGRLISCACGVRLWTEKDLEDVRRCVGHAVESHSRHCPSRLVFSALNSAADHSELVGVCHVCDFMTAAL
ncbi:hypothetical protein HPB47_011072 [Ixodes persulcatus]|uniref:Uncharacterized protein n=1 Tax=Ixodes persulcatus TaxID=34615 RepID=A0AC60NX93_IXOPE|nr:hypothetical protein HPB47_011072 [Ixodes persulcatus]